MTYDEVEKLYEAALDACNSRQRKFVEHLVGGKSQAEAARLAGYAKCSNKWTHRMMANDGVAEALKLGRQLATMGAKTTAEWARSVLKEVVDGARADGDRPNMVSALRELAKIDGLNAPEKRELTANVQVTSPDELKTDELAALAALRHGTDVHTSH